MRERYSRVPRQILVTQLTNFKIFIPSSTSEEASTFVSIKLNPCGCRR